MRSSRAVKLLFAGVLTLSLAGKLAASASVPYPPPEPTAVAAERMLRDAGFRTSIVRTARSPQAFTRAARGDCRLLLGEYPVHGTFADVYQNLARPFGSLRFAYRGSVYDEQPKLRSLFDFLIWRELRRVRVDTGRAPVIAVAATSPCRLDAIPWERLAKLSG